MCFIRPPETSKESGLNPGFLPDYSVFRKLEFCYNRRVSDPEHQLPKAIGKPATNALLNAGINTLDQISGMTDKELLALHGVGPKAIKILRDQIKKVRGL